MQEHGRFFTEAQKVQARLVSPVGTLNNSDHFVDGFFASFFEFENAFRFADKDLGLSVFKVRDAKATQDRVGVPLAVSRATGPGGIIEHLVMFKEVVIVATKRKSCTAHANVFDHTQVTDLVRYQFSVVHTAALFVVWLNRTDVVRFALFKISNKCLHITNKRGSSGDRFLSVMGFWHELAEELGLGALHQALEIGKKGVLVLVQHVIYTVNNISCIVLDHKL
mmetsp:Transcript_15361/g.27307  ORF Transcript_15361/g.27307 Transcript_15361/m.27307 type:complete len:223 (-) Transcript_15361:1234-1902(-)